ncbi:MAG: hypothetical protein K1X75_05935 [Leptospirales bacterium]|nr:hypothetical protein [Leptospirales bacterium]
MRSLRPTEYLKASLRAGICAPSFLWRPYRSLASVRAYQTVRIRKLLEHAYCNTAFYRRLYDRAGVHPRQFRKLEDLSHFPTVSKNDLVQALQRGELGRRPRQCIDSVSSGSSGQVIEVRHNVNELHPYAVGRFRILNISGQLWPWTSTLYVYTSAFPARSYFGLFPSRFIPTLAPLESIVDALRRFRPRILCIYPSRLDDLAQFLSPAQCRGLGLGLISLNSELSSAAQREAWSERFSCRVLDEYSTEELGWVAAQCAFGRYHLWEDMSYIETLRFDSDAASDQGEICGINLHNFATPFIRYRQGDAGAIGLERCPCGRQFRTLSHLEGRNNDAFRFGALRLSPAVLLDGVYSLLLERPLPIADFRLWQLEENLVRFYARPASGADDRLALEIMQRLRPLFPDHVRLEVEIAAELPKTARGKRNPIRSLLGEHGATGLQSGMGGLRR